MKTPTRPLAIGLLVVAFFALVLGRAQAGGSHPEHLAWGGAGERRVAVGPLLEGEGGALVGLDVGPQ